ncbi:MAG: c-type cytochrome [Solirubrobacteraceae bacterium]|jgi:mono/diheme cytochrome c family protein
MRLVATGSASRLSRPAGLGLGAAVLVALGGCQVKQGQPDLVNGKRLFVSKCGSCHVLGRAGTKGQVGPNLDHAFQAALGSGFGRSSVRGIVDKQILYPARTGQMPAKLVTGRNAQDVAAYVAAVVARPGKDTGALATAVGGGQKPLAVAKGGKLDIPADPNGQLLFTFKDAQAKPGSVSISSPNKSSVAHNIAIQGPGANQVGPIGQGGHVSTIRVTLKPGSYTFYCSVDAHRQGGMMGKLTVK